MSTRAELRTRVVAITKRTDKTTVINEALDMGLADAAWPHDWREMKSIETLSASAGDTSISLPTGTHHVSEARFINGTQSHKLIILPRTRFLRMFPNVADAQETKPQYVYVDNDTMFFNGPLSDDFDIYATCYILPSFTDDSTENPISVLNNALTYFMLSFLYDSMEMFSAARVWDGRY